MMFEYIADLICFNVLGLDPAARFCESLHFFIYDILKILFSMVVVLSIISFLRTYLSAKKVNKILSKSRFGASYLIASLFGVISPFCSCSSVPLFIGFLKAGVPVGVAFAFLITSPLVNEIVFVLMIGTFGLKTALLYAVFGVVLGVVGGIVLGKMGFEKDIININVNPEKEHHPRSLKKRIELAIFDTREIIKSILPYVLAGIGIGALIHGYIPEEMITNYINSDSIFAVPIAVLIGVPIYVGCSTLVPVVFAITQKGIVLGTALAFMMSVAGLSFPQGVMLKSVMRWRLLVTFFGIVSLGIIIIGYLFNLIY